MKNLNPIEMNPLLIRILRMRDQMVLIEKQYEMNLNPSVKIFRQSDIMKMIIHMVSMNVSQRNNPGLHLMRDLIDQTSLTDQRGQCLMSHREMIDLNIQVDLKLMIGLSLKIDLNQRIGLNQKEVIGLMMSQDMKMMDMISQGMMKGHSVLIGMKTVLSLMDHTALKQVQHVLNLDRNQDNNLTERLKDHQPMMTSLTKTKRSQQKSNT